MIFAIPNPFYAIAKKMIEAQIKLDFAKREKSSSKQTPTLKQFVPIQDHPTMPGFYKLLNETPGKTGIVYVNGQFHSIHPPGSNEENELSLAGTVGVRPGESSTYNSETDEVTFSGGCPQCGITRGLDNNLYDSKGIITTNITSGCTPCPANCSPPAVSQLINKKTQENKSLGLSKSKNSIMLL